MKNTLLISIFCLFSASLFAAEIHGKISSKNEQPINSAKISLIQSGITISETFSNTNGYYSFQNIKPGHYSIYAEAKDHKKSLPQTLILTEQSKKEINFILTSKQNQTPEILIIEDNETEEDIQLDEVIINCEEPNFVKNESPSVFSRKNKSPRGKYRSIRKLDCSEGAPQVTHNTEDYDYIKENIFHTALNEPLSTFSVDVDKASYSNIRRFINQNQMPPKDAVRIEELINYFDYDYAQPTDGHPFASHLEYGDCPWNKKHKLLMIGLKGEEMDNEEVPASNIVFLLDVSGSMNSYNKLPLLKQSFNILINKLRPQDRVAIVVYAGNAGCVLESTSGLKKDKIIAALDRLQAGGSTAGGAGIKLAYKIAKENFLQGGNNRIILATDGDFNVGASSDAELERMIETKRDDGIFLTILGFGMGNYKDNKMEKLSNKGNGNYAYIDNILEAKKVFSEELWGTLYTIAKDVKIQVEFNPAFVDSYRLIGYENRMLENEDFNDDKKDAGEIGAGHTVTALYEIIPSGTNECQSSVDELIYQSKNTIKSNDLMTLKLRYKAPDENSSRLLTKSIKAKHISDSENSMNFKLATSAAMFGMLLRDSEFKGDSSWDKLLTNAKSAKGEDRFGYRSEFIKLIEKAKLMN